MGEPQIVQVRIPGARRSYAYTWDGPELKVGDWVELPGNDVSPDGTEGRVEEFGADGYKGPMKAIAGVKEKQDPWMARMRQVKTPADRLQVYRRAQKAGISGERLQKLVELGKQVLEQQSDRMTPAGAAILARAVGERGPSDASTVSPPLTSAQDAAEHRARRAPDPVYDIPAATGSIGRVDASIAAGPQDRVDAGSSQENTRDWGEWN